MEIKQESLNRAGGRDTPRWRMETAATALLKVAEIRWKIPRLNAQGEQDGRIH
jgi:hypothetical protein